MSETERRFKFALAEIAAFPCKKGSCACSKMRCPGCIAADALEYREGPPASVALICPRCESGEDVCAADPAGEKFCAGCFHAWGPGTSPLDGLSYDGYASGLPLVHEFVVTIDDPSDGYVTACARHAREIARDQGGTLTGETRRAPDGYCPLCPEEITE